MRLDDIITSPKENKKSSLVQCSFLSFSFSLLSLSLCDIYYVSFQSNNPQTSGENPIDRFLCVPSQPVPSHSHPWFSRQLARHRKQIPIRRRPPFDWSNFPISSSHSGSFQQRRRMISLQGHSSFFLSFIVLVLLFFGDPFPFSDSILFWRQFHISDCLLISSQLYEYKPSKECERKKERRTFTLDTHSKRSSSSSQVPKRTHYYDCYHINLVVVGLWGESSNKNAIAPLPKCVGPIREASERKGSKQLPR